MAFPLPPNPPTELGRYRVLSSTAGVRVSPLVLGGASFGTALADLLGPLDEQDTFKLIDAYVEAGGNFFDTANGYQREQSETFIGNWLASRGQRDTIFLATKFTNAFCAHSIGMGKAVTYGGNHKKSLFLSVEASLKKLHTSYIDLLYVHWWDWTTSIEELMDFLHVMVQQGKVLYLGASDTPAWVVSAANEYAKARGKTQFSVYQGRWSLMQRDFERDIIPMARQYGMALCPWGVLGSGSFQTKKQLEARKQADEGGRGSAEQSKEARKVSEALEQVAAAHSTESIQQIALAYAMQKTRNVFPVIGGRKVEHLHDNIAALSIHLTNQEIKYLEGVGTFDIGFPMNYIGEDPKEVGVQPPVMESLTGAKIAWQRSARPIGHEDALVTLG